MGVRHMIIRALAVAALSVALAGCLGAPQPRKATLDLNEYEPYGRAGNATVQGEAFLVRQDGVVVPAAGCDIHLVPVTAYSTEFYERTVKKGEDLETADQRVRPFTRTTVGNSLGHFTFTDLPAGDYYVYTWIIWKAYDSNRYVGIYEYNTGGSVYDKIHVSDGQTVKVMLH